VPALSVEAALLILDRMNVDELVDVVVRTLEREGVAATVTVVAPGMVTVTPERAHGAPVEIVVGARLVVRLGVGVRVGVTELEELSALVKTVASGQLTERLATRSGRTVSRGAAVGDAPLRLLGMNTSMDWLFGKNTMKVTYPAYPPGAVTRVER
jgi:hypothetical protein